MAVLSTGGTWIVRWRIQPRLKKDSLLPSSQFTTYSYSNSFSSKYVTASRRSLYGQSLHFPRLFRNAQPCRESTFVVRAISVKGKPKKREVVIPDPDYRIPIVLLGLAGAFVYQDNLLVAAPFGLLGLLLLFQTTRIRFVFDDEALELKVGNQLQESGENVFVGGKNRWKYSTFVNWEFWWPSFPVLVYFKETQTKPEGQVHFFPIILNGKQLYEVMVERAGPSQTSGPRILKRKEKVPYIVHKYTCKSCF